MRDGWREEPFKPYDRAVRKVLDALKHLAGKVYIDDEIDAPCWLRGQDRPEPKNLIALQNCILDLETGENIPHSADFLSMTALPFAYDPEAKCERWEKFIEEIFPDCPAEKGARREFQKAVGYLVSSDRSQQKIFLVKGPARSGKGTIIRILSALIGRENVISPKLSELREHFGRQQLIDKKAAFFPDERLDGRTSSIVEWLLSISGEDDVSIARKHQKNWHGRLGVRCWIATNTTPGFEDASAVIASRFIVFKLTQSFAGKEDTGLTNALLSELPGILNWAMAGLRMLRADGKFIQPAEAQEDIEQMRRIASPILPFADEHLEIGPDRCVELAKVHDAYVEWCADAKHKPLSRTKFGSAITDAFPGVILRYRGSRGSQVPMFEGIGLRKPGGCSVARQNDDPTAANVVALPRRARL